MPISWPIMPKKYLRPDALGPIARFESEKQGHVAAVCLLSLHLHAAEQYDGRLSEARKALTALHPPRSDLAAAACRGDGLAQTALARQMLQEKSSQRSVLLPLPRDSQTTVPLLLLEFRGDGEMHTLYMHGRWGGGLALSAPPCHPIVAENIRWELPEVKTLLQLVTTPNRRAAGDCSRSLTHFDRIALWVQQQGHSSRIMAGGNSLAGDYAFPHALNYLASTLPTAVYCNLLRSFNDHIQQSIEAWQQPSRGLTPWTTKTLETARKPKYLLALRARAKFLMHTHQQHRVYNDHRASGLQMLGFFDDDLARICLRQSSAARFCLVPQDHKGTFHVLTFRPREGLLAALLKGEFPSRDLYLRPWRRECVASGDEFARAQRTFRSLADVAEHLTGKGYAPLQRPAAQTLHVLRSERDAFVSSLRLTYGGRPWYLDCRTQAEENQMWQRYPRSLVSVGHHPLVGFTASFRDARAIRHEEVPVDKLGFTADSWRLILPWRDGRGVRDFTELAGEVPL